MRWLMGKQGARRAGRIFVAVALVVGLGGGCANPAQHQLTLVAPPNQCDANDPSCPPYLGCSDLGITSLSIQVGIYDGESTDIDCPADLVSGMSQVMVAYDPGEDFYMVDTSFPRDGSTVYLSAGPFSEDESQTPWKLLLR